MKKERKLLVFVLLLLTTIVSVGAGLVWYWNSQPIASNVKVYGLNGEAWDTRSFANYTSMQDIIKLKVQDPIADSRHHSFLVGLKTTHNLKTGSTVDIRVNITSVSPELSGMVASCYLTPVVYYEYTNLNGPEEKILPYIWNTTAGDWTYQSDKAKFADFIRRYVTLATPPHIDEWNLVPTSTVDGDWGSLTPSIIVDSVLEVSGSSYTVAYADLAMIELDEASLPNHPNHRDTVKSECNGIWVILEFDTSACSTFGDYSVTINVQMGATAP